MYDFSCLRHRKFFFFDSPFVVTQYEFPDGEINLPVGYTLKGCRKSTFLPVGAAVSAKLEGLQIFFFFLLNRFLWRGHRGVVIQDDWQLIETSGPDLLKLNDFLIDEIGLSHYSLDETVCKILFTVITIHLYTSKRRSSNSKTV